MFYAILMVDIDKPNQIMSDFEKFPAVLGVMFGGNVKMDDMLQKLAQEKSKYINHQWESLDDFQYIRKEVLQSWERSRKAQVPINRGIAPRFPSQTTVENILENNKTLIDITKKVFTTFNTYNNTNDQFFILYGKDGIVLADDDQSIQHLFNKETFIGTYSTEDKVGTVSHNLCMQLKRPLQISGPEHYCHIWQNFTASSAPIFDERHEIIATLSLCQLLSSANQNPQLSGLYGNSLASITIAAHLIETQVFLTKYSGQASRDNLLLNDICNYVGSITMMVDQGGRVFNINNAGRERLQLQQADLPCYAWQLFGHDSPILDILLKQSNQTTKENCIVSLCGKNYMAIVFPAVNSNSIISNEKFTTVSLLEIPGKQISTAKVTQTKSLFTFDSIKGDSPAMQTCKKMAQKYAVLSDNILLLGETGTGKEMFAQSIHQFSRPNGPFVAVNCAAMPRELVESELFGYEGGSFTGAERKGKVGKIEAADQGTLFLDEIGDMPIEVQTVLLRTLQDKCVTRVGSDQCRSVDFRLIAATNQDLFDLVQKKQFREDLFYRLSVLALMIPSLRDRKGDLDLLIDHFLHNYCHLNNLRVPTLDQDARAYLHDYRWPGNVRQLRNVLTFAVNSADDGIIRIDDLPLELFKKEAASNIMSINIAPSRPEGLTSAARSSIPSLAEMEIQLILDALRKTNNNYSKAASLLGINRSTLYKKVKNLNISQTIED